jgi:hypothetical protein
MSDQTRRQFIRKAVSAGAAAGLAGCPDSSGNEESDEKEGEVTEITETLEPVETPIEDELNDNERFVEDGEEFEVYSLLDEESYSQEMETGQSTTVESGFEEYSLEIVSIPGPDRVAVELNGELEELEEGQTERFGDFYLEIEDVTATENGEGAVESNIVLPSRVAPSKYRFEVNDDGEDGTLFTESGYSRGLSEGLYVRGHEDAEFTKLMRVEEINESGMLVEYTNPMEVLDLEEGESYQGELQVEEVREGETTMHLVGGSTLEKSERERILCNHGEEAFYLLETDPQNESVEILTVDYACA